MDYFSGPFTEYLSGHFKDYDKWPWAYYNSVERQIHEHPSFVLGEFLFIALALLSLYHAFTAEKSERRRLKLLWVLTFVVGTANDYFFMMLPLVDNFWQAQAIIMLTPRMPLYIPCVYNGFMYWSTMAAARVFRFKQKSLLAEAALAGLLGGVLYAPYDVSGARFLWWTWHHDDPAVRLRWLGVPASSTLWTIVFTFCFSFLFGYATDKGYNAWCTTAVCMLSTPWMMMFMPVLTIISTDQLGLIGPRSIIGTVIVCAAIIARHLSRCWNGQVETPNELQRLIRPEPTIVRNAIIAFYIALVINMAVFSPERQISTGCHQEFGDCQTMDKDIMFIDRMRYICNEKHPDFYFKVDCPAAAHNWQGRWKRITPDASKVEYGQRLASWYTVCGVEHQSLPKWMFGVVALGTVGSLMYIWALGSVAEGWRAPSMFLRRAPSVRGQSKEE